MAKSPRNNDPRAEHGDSQQSSGTYVEVLGTSRRRKRGTNSSAPKEPVQASVSASANAETGQPAKRQSVRPAAIPAEQIRLPSGAVAYVSPALPRASRAHDEPHAERSPPSAELHLDAPSWVDSGPTDRNFPAKAAPFKVPRTIREVIPRRIEAERVEFERSSQPPATEARQSTVQSINSESTRPRASLEAVRQSSIPSESTRPRAVVDCIPDETTQGRARLSAVQASLVLASKSDRPPAMTSSMPPPPAAGASVLDAKPQLVSDPPEPRKTSWVTVTAVAMLCSIISAAAVVAFKEAQGESLAGTRRETIVAPVAKQSPTLPTVTALASKADRPVAEVIAPAPAAPSVSPVPAAEHVPTVGLNPASSPSAEAAMAGGQIAVAPQALQAQPTAAPAPTAPLAAAPAAALPLHRASSRNAPVERATHAAADVQDGAQYVPPPEAVTMRSALTPADTKAVLTKLADDERATAEAEERKREEERKLPSTSRLKAPSVRIEAARIAAALKKASQEAVARVNEEQAAPASAPAAPKTESSALPDNPF
jgi:hypothetical protein